MFRDLCVVRCGNRFLVQSPLEGSVELSVTAVLWRLAALMILVFAKNRLYGPREPFFTKKWRPSEVELVK